MYWQITATGVAVLIVDKFGRKPLLAISAIVMCISISCLGVFFKLDSDGDADDLGWLPLVSCQNVIYYVPAVFCMYLTSNTFPTFRLV